MTWTSAKAVLLITSRTSFQFLYLDCKLGFRAKLILHISHVNGFLFSWTDAICVWKRVENTYRALLENQICKDILNHFMKKINNTNVKCVITTLPKNHYVIFISMGSSTQYKYNLRNSLVIIKQQILSVWFLYFDCMNCQAFETTWKQFFLSLKLTS